MELSIFVKIYEGVFESLTGNKKTNYDTSTKRQNQNC